MIEKVESCAECTQNCMLIHAKRKDPSAIVTSFFKVMFGDKCTQLLFIPPKFAPTISSLVDQTTHLEDSSGERWVVTLSKVDGLLAFQKGWHEFSSAHCLKVGEFLIFNYIKGSHFVVQIYDYTGCEKQLIFAKENVTPKNCRTSGNSNPEDVVYSRKKRKTNGPHSGSSDKQASSSDFEIREGQPILAGENSNLNKEVNATASEYVEEQFYMIGRDAGYVQQDHRAALYDLSEFETNKFPVEVEKNCGPASKSTVRPLTELGMDKTRFDGAKKSTVEDKRIDGLADTLMQSLTQADVATDSVAVEAPNAESPLKVEHFIRKDKNLLPRDKFVLSAAKDFEKNDKKLLKNPAEANKVKLKNPEGKSIAHSSGMAKVVKTEIVEKFELQTFGFHGKLATTIGECDHSSKMATTKENDDEVLKAVKTEPFTSFDPPNAANVSCVVESIDQAFFELPKCLPTVSYRKKSVERRVVYLRDPLQRLWPVFYLQKHYLKVLTGGWEAFSKANSIQPGDECIFGLETEPDNIYTVTIVRK